MIRERMDVTSMIRERMDVTSMIRERMDVTSMIQDREDGSAERRSIRCGQCRDTAMMLPTPCLRHLTTSNYEHVYEPVEDSFLFLDALEKDAKFLTALRPDVCLEVGSGSGVVSAFIARLLGNNTYYICTDINPLAAIATQGTARQNHVILNTVVTDLTASLLPRLTGQVDVLLFNPPYVVTPSEEVGSRGIEASYAGGRDGREVTDRFFPGVPKLLSPRGTFYLIVIKENKQDEIETLMRSYGLKMEVVLTRRSGPEHLSVLKFTWTT
ncbi:Methyltransferase N6AMT1 [Lamellibrachia satsuma]|nr:Methyltransferase N6AMT1 [Lamellibrachia satsuma]